VYATKSTGCHNSRQWLRSDANNNDFKIIYKQSGDNRYTPSVEKSIHFYSTKSEALNNDTLYALSNDMVTHFS
jgi:hypothetical protein